MPLAAPGGLGGWWRRRHYANPFRHATSLLIGRVDMGVDYHGEGRIDAIGRARVVGIGGAGWPDNVYIDYKLLRGRHKGRHVYLAEAVKPRVETGQKVRKGQHLADFTADGAPGGTGIETGWGTSIVNLTWAAQNEQPLPPGNADTVAGKCFARFLANHGAPAPTVPNPHGPEFPA